MRGVGKLHERYPERAPTADEAEAIARTIFHLKHVPPSNDPEDRPGAYERAADASAGIVRRYAEGYGDDFERRRQLEVRFEIPLRDSVLGGSIDLLLRLDDEGEILDASVVDFKTMEGGPDPEGNPGLDWTELALQVQLYARAAAAVLDANARTGAVHLLKDGQRIEVPVSEDAVESAVQNVEWAAERIIAEDFPMRPHPEKCGECDWQRLCPQSHEEFEVDEQPPPLHLPESQHRMVRAFSEAISAAVPRHLDLDSGLLGPSGGGQVARHSEQADEALSLLVRVRAMRLEHPHHPELDMRGHLIASLGAVLDMDVRRSRHDGL